jgi:hypothetical protein
MLKTMLSDNSNACASRDEIDVVRTIYWFEGLRIRARVATAYALERRIEPESFGKNRFGDPIRRNKWGRYRSGKHTPSTSMVAQANRIFPRSEKDLNHILWRVLRFDGTVGERAHGWLRELAPELQLLIFERNDHVRIHGGRQYLGKLERRASMDCLAGLVILLRLNIEHGFYERALEYSQSIFRVLLMLGLQFDERKLGDEIFRIFVKRIFSFIKWDGCRLHCDGYDFVQAVHILHSFSLNTKQSKGKQLSWEELVSYMCKVLAGDYGFDLKFALGPLTTPDNEMGPLSNAEQQKFNQVVRLQKWGIENVLNGGMDRFPPPEILRVVKG